MTHICDCELLSVITYFSFGRSDICINYLLVA